MTKHTANCRRQSFQASSRWPKSTVILAIGLFAAPGVLSAQEEPPDPPAGAPGPAEPEPAEVDERLLVEREADLRADRAALAADKAALDAVLKARLDALPHRSPGEIRRVVEAFRAEFSEELADSIQRDRETRRRAKRLHIERAHPVLPPEQVAVLNTYRQRRDELRQRYRIQFHAAASLPDEEGRRTEKQRLRSEFEDELKQLRLEQRAAHAAADSAPEAPEPPEAPAPPAP